MLLQAGTLQGVPEGRPEAPAFFWSPTGGDASFFTSITRGEFARLVQDLKAAIANYASAGATCAMSMGRASAVCDLPIKEGLARRPTRTRVFPAAFPPRLRRWLPPTVHLPRACCHLPCSAPLQPTAWSSAPRSWRCRGCAPAQCPSTPPTPRSAGYFYCSAASWKSCNLKV